MIGCPISVKFECIWLIRFVKGNILTSNSFETSNGISREESGISYPGPEQNTGSYTISGSYEFTHPDGTVDFVTYIADENGNRVEGDVIPVFNGRVNIQDA